MANGKEMAQFLFRVQSLVRKSGARLFDQEFRRRQKKGIKKEESSNHHIGMAIKRMELQ